MKCAREHSIALFLISELLDLLIMSGIKTLSAFLLVFLFSALELKAQQEYFVYLQTENQKPFYAKLDNKVVSSTSSGYLILPKIQEGRYLVTIGFPKNEYPEEQFSIEVKENNVGYLLKQLKDDEFSLFNLQTLAVVNAIKNEDEQMQIVETVKDDPFTTMLAKATKDPTLLKSVEKVPAQPVEKKQAEATEVSAGTQSLITLRNEQSDNKSETAAAQKQVDVDVSGAGESSDSNSSVAVSAEKPLSGSRSSALDNDIKRILYVQGRDGNEMIYVDESGAANDTVRVFIPQTGEAAKSVISLREDKNIPEPKAKLEDKKEDLPYTITPTVIAPKEEAKKQSVIIYEDKTQKQEEKAVINEQKQEEKKVEGELIVLPPVSKEVKNENCKNVAGDKEFLRIRRRMAVERTREGMIEAARRMFKTTCFSTEQIRNLSFMFLDDEGRYMFFDAAYGHASDPDRFESLESLLNDEYYVNRFRALINK